MRRDSITLQQLDDRGHDVRALPAGLCRAHGDMLRVVMALLNNVGPFTLVSREETGNGWS